MKCSVKTTKAEKEQKTKIGAEQEQQIENSKVVDINPSTSIINLNINGLNAEQIKKTQPISCLYETHFKYKGTCKFKVKEWRKRYHTKPNEKKAGVTINF